MFATGGIVYLDANNDGIRQQGEAIARGLSNSGYSFTGLQPGTYIVRYDEGSGPALGGKSTPWYEVTVNPQQTAMNINFGVVGPTRSRSPSSTTPTAAGRATRARSGWRTARSGSIETTTTPSRSTSTIGR
jgi:hypothetical protein